jgi:hypothetical protein
MHYYTAAEPVGPGWATGFGHMQKSGGMMMMMMLYLFKGFSKES